MNIFVAYFIETDKEFHSVEEVFISRDDAVAYAQQYPRGQVQIQEWKDVSPKARRLVETRPWVVGAKEGE